MNRRLFNKALLTSIFWPSWLKAKSVLVDFKARMRELSSAFVLPSDKDFFETAKLFNVRLRKALPKAILQSKSVSDYQQSFKDPLIQSEKWFIRSGGHSFSGFSLGFGVVFDVRQFKDVHVIGDRVKLGSGLNLGEVQAALKPTGLAIPNGTCPRVGLAGFLTGGGHSSKSRTWGLGCDRVLSMDVILADGDLLRVSPTESADLYWALLGGGGGNFALVQNFELKAFRSKGAAVFTFHFSGDRAQDIFEFWEQQSFSESDSISVAFFVQARDGQIEKVRVTGHIHNQSEEDINDAFENTQWVKLYDFDPEVATIKHRRAHHIRPKGLRYAFFGSSQYAKHLIGREGFQKIQSAIKETTDGSSIALLFEPLGGQILNPKYDNAYPHRHCRYVIEVHSSYLDLTQEARYKVNFNRFNRQIDGLFSKRQYVNYCDLELKDWGPRYYAQNLERLLEIKQKYDPNNRFSFGEQSLGELL